VGRHAAADDAGTDPIVAAALARRSDASGARRAPRAEGTESGLGWPGDTTTGGGLGWPGSADTAAPDGMPLDGTASDGTASDGTASDGTASDGTASDGTEETARMDAVPPVPAPEDEPEPRGPRGGWRRLFSGRAA